MLNFKHATMMRIRAESLRLQCQIDNTSPVKIPDLLRSKLRDTSPDCEIWTRRLIATLTDVATLVRRAKRPVKREWLYRFTVDAGSFIPTLSKTGRLPESIIMLPGVKVHGLTVRVSRDTLDEQCYWLMIALFKHSHN